MSYILDALKKADAARERESESVPGLHSRHEQALTSRPVPLQDAAPTHATVPARSLPWPLTLGVGALAGVAALIGWQALSLGRHEPPHATAPPRLAGPSLTPSGAPASTAPATPVSAVPTAAQALPSPPAAIPPQAEPGTRAAPPAGAPPGTASAKARELAPPVQRKRADEPQPLRVDAALRPPEVSAVPWQQLPEDVRRGLPPLQVGGAMHSDVASQRMLILNGGLYREGDQPAPGLLLEEIRLKSAVLRYREHRFVLSY